MAINKKLLLPVAVIGLFVFGAILLRPKNSAVTAQDIAPINYPKYADYSDSAFVNSADKKRVLFFWAPWCSTCGPADAEFQNKVGEIPDDVALFRVNYDRENALKTKYNVAYQHTFILVDNNGDAIKSWVGGGLEELLTKV